MLLPGWSTFLELPTSVTYMGCSEVVVWKGEVICLPQYRCCCTAGVIVEEFLCPNVLLGGGRSRISHKWEVIILCVYVPFTRGCNKYTNVATGKILDLCLSLAYIPQNVQR